MAVAAPVLFTLRRISAIDCTCSDVKPLNTGDPVRSSTHSGAIKRTRAKVLNTAPARSMKAATKAMLRFTGRSKTYQRAVFATLRHFDEKDREAQLEQAFVRQDVVRGRRGAAEINQSVADETLRVYAANYQDEIK